MKIHKFTTENVLASAREKTGLSTFRTTRFLPGMTQMIESMRNDARLTEGGISAQFERFVGLTANRLLADRLFLERPEILAQPLGPFTVIIGLPRTGTTKLQRVLARHPDVNFTTGWEVLLPVPFAGDKAEPDDDRRNIVARSLEAQHEEQPRMKAIHEFVVDEAEEDALLMLHSFTNAALFNVRIPGYTAWLRQQDTKWTYVELLDYLKLLQWQHDRIGRSWVLKNVLHVAHLREFLSVAPETRFVWVHRDPAEALGSWSSLVSTIRTRLSDDVDQKQVGREQLEFWQWAIDAGMTARTALPPDRFIDINYCEVISDLRGVLEKILAFASLDRSDEVLRHLLDWEAGNAQGKHGAHRYTLEDFGLSSREVHDAFDTYMNRYALV